MSGLSKKEGWIFHVKKSGIHPCQKMLGVLGSRQVEVVSATNFVGIAFSVQILHIKLRPHPKADFGIHSRDAYPQFADVWVPPGYHIEYLHILEYSFAITLGYLASRG